MIRILIILIGIIVIDTSCNRDNNNKNSQNSKIIKDSISNQTEKEIEKSFDIAKIIERNKHEGKYLFLLQDSIFPQDLEYIPPSILRLIRNEIFAKYSYIFRDKELQDYFSSFIWYVPYYNNVDTLLTGLDRYNINILLNAEKKNKEISKSELFDIYLNLVDNSPKALCYIFDCSKLRTDYSDEYMGGFVKEYVFKTSKKYKYLLSGFFAGCDACNYQYHLEKYSTDGDLLENIDFGISYEFEVKIDECPDKLIITSYDRELKKQYSDSSKFIVQMEEELYEDVSKYYNSDTIVTKIILNDKDEIEIKQFTTAARYSQ